MWECFAFNYLRGFEGFGECKVLNFKISTGRVTLVQLEESPMDFTYQKDQLIRLGKCTVYLTKIMNMLTN